MDGVYDLHRHTHCVTFFIKYVTIVRRIYSNSTRRDRGESFSSLEDSYITYDKRKSKVLSWGIYHGYEDEDTVQIDISEERLHRLFKKGKDSWDQDDKFLFKAVSDYIRLSVENLMEKENRRLKQVKDTDALHYVFVVPSEWEEEIREVLIRPIFVRANLISKDDHKDRLLFCTDIEAFYYDITRNQYPVGPMLARNTIIGRIVVVEESKMSIKLDSILIGNPLFNFSNSLLFPKLVASNSSFLTTNDVKNGIREFIKINFSFDAQEETIRNIMEEVHVDSFEKITHKDKASYLEKHFITDKSISELDKKYATLIKSIRPIDICAEISKNLPNNLKLLLPNDAVKEYSILNLTVKRWRRKIDKGLFDWSEYLFEYNRISFSSNYIVLKRSVVKELDYQNVLEGAVRYLFYALHNSDIYSNPRMLSAEHSTTSSSIFLKSKPDAILNIDISLESTMLSYSRLDENGLVKEIWNHDYFVHDIPLRSLGSFFSFSEVTTLNVKSSFINISDIDNKKINGIIRFIKSVKEHLKDKWNISSGELNKEIENVLNFDSRNKDLLVSTQQQVYIKAFLTLNQVVTESGSENEYQEAIVIQEEMIPIPNIYKSLCSNMWNNIIEDSSLIQLCDTHKGYGDNELLGIFSLKNRTEFTNNLKEYISKNILNKTLNERKTDATTISLSTSCKCRVCLTANDITEISFRPVLQDIISLIFTSLINKQLFGKYRNIQYVFHLVRFNYNPQFQRIIIKILEDETDYFLYEERIDIAHYTIPKLSNQLLQPVIQQEPFSYKAFQVGVLYHVYSENYGFGFNGQSDRIHYKFKNKISDSKITSINEETVFPLFKKGNRINNTQIKRVFYLSSEYETTVVTLLMSK
ncbi:hypothetical protein HPULCUR_003877 [Helicostylum pulchrum]|uniref:F-box domain-containing protein n=1 Tax=Helicostylum pulchrum TaxID=562976 RepID=A0ABP9XW43_9FUNG